MNAMPAFVSKGNPPARLLAAAIRCLERIPHGVIALLARCSLDHLLASRAGLVAGKV